MKAFRMVSVAFAVLTGACDLPTAPPVPAVLPPPAAPIEMKLAKSRTCGPAAPTLRYYRRAVTSADPIIVGTLGPRDGRRPVPGSAFVAELAVSTRTTGDGSFVLEVPRSRLSGVRPVTLRFRAFGHGTASLPGLRLSAGDSIVVHAHLCPDEVRVTACGFLVTTAGASRAP